ncbi:hypothetical protein Poli38472_007880 [Pythium oligandrum]|uniref:Mre11 DNA-binding domain-containing protein n=1 Tax=Pythium oligandrum TaxID=41045 RepID=A0A8K1CSN1_PYTOL|nr:hypothetical protein Poli38472_007880 [Pythium oligandrum]|eukprot:TMW68208.1 hypothetical protein Poli38472_007880 [Pythium oligandrum]
MATGGGIQTQNTLRVLLATDNHLGYAEKDPIRGDDSFRTFQEILQLARHERVDLLLLAGDLFHENKPTRKTLYQTMRLLRTHCMGDGAVQFQIVSDQSINFPNFGTVNYEDPNYNIHLPVFSIHGNHDDPSRDAGGADAQATSLAALDLLSAANLVNYFGKSEKVDAIEVFPVLMVKGSTKVAIYGLGNMRDERLHRMFAQRKVVFRRPAEAPESWFSIFVVHQNRDDRGRGTKNCLPESMIPDFIDFVVWGHEHECLIDVEESVKGDFFITQPGSSVATSLVEGEAKAKHVGVLEIHQQSFRLSTRELKTVRPFKMTDVILSEEESLDPNDPDVTGRLQEILEERVRELLIQVDEEERASGQKRPPELRQPLIRVRVEHSGFPVLVNQRFGGRFVGKVANPNDILLFYRRKKAQTSATDKKDGIMTGAEKKRALSLLTEPIRPTRLDTVTIEDLLTKQLHRPEQSLVFLPEAPLAIALEEYIVKNIPSALDDFVTQVLEDTQRDLVAKKDAKSKQEIASEVEKKKERVNAAHLVDEEEGRTPTASPLRSQPLSARSRLDSLDGSDEEFKSEDTRKTTKSSSARVTKATPATARSKRATKPAASVNEEEDSFGSDAMEEVATKKPAATTRKRTTPVKKAPTPRKAPARTATTKRKAQRDVFSDEEEEVDNDGDEDYEFKGDDDDESEAFGRGKGDGKARRQSPVAKPKGKTPPRKRLRRATSDNEDDDDTFSAGSKQATVGDGEINLCSSDSDATASTAISSAAKPARKRPTPQPKITDMFMKERPAPTASVVADEHDDVESDREFTQIATARRPAAESQFEVASQSQSQSQAMGGVKKRKLPLSMLSASQSTMATPKLKRDGDPASTASALRKGWGRTRR